MIMSSIHHAIRREEDFEFLKKIIMQSQGLSGNSAIIEAYEESLKWYFNVDYAIAVSSGTAAIQASLAALGVTSQDEVILPVTAAVMTGLPILSLGATPVFVDCAKNSFAICLDSLRRSISNRTKAIISVPMWGYPTFSVELASVAQQYGIPIIEDAAQAIGTKNNKKFEGTNSLIGCFSTHEIKLISTGEGGFILTNDSDINHKVRTYSKLGLNKLGKIKSNFGDIFGLNFKFNGLGAALGITEVNNLCSTLLSRQNKFALWMNSLSDSSELLKDLSLDYDTQIVNGYSALKLFTFEALQANELSLKLQDRGIETDFVRYKYQMLPQYNIFKPFYNDSKCKGVEIDFPNATRMLRQLLILPTHDGITEHDIVNVTGIIKNCIIEIIQGK